MSTEDSSAGSTGTVIPSAVKNEPDMAAAEEKETSRLKMSNEAHALTD